MRGQKYQIALIFLGLIVAALFAVFFARELFPEYKIYQDDFIALEKFRADYSHQPLAPFQTGVKQIVFEREDKGPAKIDRCISCHVALQIPQYSPTKLAADAEGTLLRSPEGAPLQVPNEEYVWLKLDQKIAELRDAAVNQQLQQSGRADEVEARLTHAEQLASLKVAKVGSHEYAVSKVLSMHPLIGNETRPFEFHPLDDYGCTLCHGGNGRGLTSEKAHGPVFDGEYEAEYMGPRPQFTEKDAHNDPLFSKVFNSKPGDALLFQTTPILPGALIQANCAQCHQTVHTALAEGLQLDSALMRNYELGQQLFIAQACYACHRIAGFSRGGVGPELTREGHNYPWFIKQKMVWPQGDLKTSTMPNLRLDHLELENLMTFLLSQKGPKKTSSDLAYRVQVKAWEEGQKLPGKLPWEESVAPSQIHNLRDSMLIFATQGCAACHRLQGFESDVGFALEKEKHAEFAALYRERQWFQSLFKEDMLGSEIVQVLEKNAHELDRRIVEGVRSASILEEIEKKFPELLESMYANFRYAARAKKWFYEQQAASASSPEAKQAAMERLQAWKQRVHRVLMAYIQEYGFGHLVGPRPNWSGVYRSDEWLMEHFRNPASHVPKSIMPIFPFDDSKFYALTYMLDTLGIRNRDRVHAIWKYRGFDPAEAYQIHCAQCHGPYMQGNGPVAEWIYPIPKNLRNPVFMLNLTREKAVQSIAHGVNGTPMPPWGEAAAGKPTYDGIPVLREQEIEDLVDWLFSMIPGAGTYQEKEVPKWRYEPADVLHELQKENNRWLSDVRADQQVVQLFNSVPNPVSGGDTHAYYIKKKYYTEQNIEAGKQFFQLNCAVCHGPEAEGTGIRSSVMDQAKPRMLTNLDWLNTRDDLRLLRSIKYGVGGTAMTPWGDLTNSLQRLQLVIYIRSLSSEKELREALAQAIYRAFDQTAQTIENARGLEFTTLQQLQSQLQAVEAQQKAAFSQAEKEKTAMEKAVKLYQQQIEISAQLKKEQQADQKLQQLRRTVLKEKELYLSMGSELIAAQLDGPIWSAFLELVKLNEGVISTLNGKLSWTPVKGYEAQQAELAQKILSGLDKHVQAVEQAMVTAEGKIASPEREAELHTLKAKLTTYHKLASSFKARLQQLNQLRQEAQQLIE